jgi:adenylate cyclase
MGREIERKFLLKSDEWRKGITRSIAIRQGYLSVNPDSTVRVRIAGEKAYLTIKGRSEGAARDEFEYPIPVEDADHMLLNLCQRKLEKTRHLVPHVSGTWEVDEFHAARAGLIVAELELSDENQSITLPDWIGEEVTSDPNYANSALAT